MLIYIIRIVIILHLLSTSWPWSAVYHFGNLLTLMQKSLVIYHKHGCCDYVYGIYTGEASIKHPEHERSTVPSIVLTEITRESPHSQMAICWPSQQNKMILIQREPFKLWKWTIKYHFLITMSLSTCHNQYNFTFFSTNIFKPKLANICWNIYLFFNNSSNLFSNNNARNSVGHLWPTSSHNQLVWSIQLQTTLILHRRNDRVQ